MWRSRPALISVVLACSLLGACASTPRVSYHKLGVSESRLASDSQACWTRSAAGDIGDAAQAVGSYLSSGPLGIALFMTTRAAEDVASGGSDRHEAHAQCMRRRGYRPADEPPVAWHPPPRRRAHHRGRPHVHYRHDRHTRWPRWQRGELRRPHRWRPQRRQPWRQARRRPRRLCYLFRECLQLCRKGALTPYVPNYTECRQTCSNDVPLCD